MNNFDIIFNGNIFGDIDTTISYQTNFPIINNDGIYAIVFPQIVQDDIILNFDEVLLVNITNFNGITKTSTYSKNGILI